MKNQLTKNALLILAVLTLFALSIYSNWQQSRNNAALKNEIDSINRQLSELKEHVAPEIHELAMN